MHETVFAERIMNEAKKHGSVTAINLEIGELAHVPAHELIECLERIVSWKISHKVISSIAQCSCGYNGHPTILERGHDYFMIECPECKQIPQLIEGTEIKLVSVTVE